MRSGEIIVDSFAGGGGASLGISWALGRGPDIAINHDREAIALHAANHPESRHYARTEVAVTRACKGCGAAIHHKPPGRPRTRCDDCVPASVRATRRPDADLAGYVRPVVTLAPRTCVTTGCDIVVSHREKKCPRCKEKQARTARMLLATAPNARGPRRKAA